MTEDLDIVRNIKLRDLLSKVPKYRESVSYSWHQNFGIIIYMHVKSMPDGGQRKKTLKLNSFGVDKVDRRRSKI